MRKCVVESISTARARALARACTTNTARVFVATNQTVVTTTQHVHPHPLPHKHTRTGHNARSRSRRRPHRGLEGTQDKVVWCDGMWCGVVWCGGEGRTYFKLCLLLPRHRHGHPTHAPNPRPPTTIRSPRCGQQREGDLGVVVTANHTG